MHYIIAGAGPAGVMACETIRKLDKNVQISLIGAEPEPPYSRMAIPYLLSEKIAEQGTYLRHEADYFEQQKIDIIQQPVVAVDSKSKLVELANGQSLHFDKLLLATGATPVSPPVPGMNLAGVQHCWTLEDARAIAQRAHPDTSVVLIGAGFIGCIILESLVQRGVNLTLVERGDRMVSRMMDKTSAQMLKEWCEYRGVRVLTGQSVSAIEEGERLQVKMDSGDTLAADLVISATGVKSNIGFLHNSDIETDQGVLVNQYLQTSQDDIYAAGDVAQARDFSTGESSMQAIQPTAVEHARIAATNMVQNNTLEHQGSLNMNILDTLGLISTSFGQWMGVAGGDEASQLDRERFKYLNLQFKDDIIVGVSSLGHIEHMGVARGMIRGRVPLGKWKNRLQENPSRLMEAYLACSLSVIKPDALL